MTRDRGKKTAGCKPRRLWRMSNVTQNIKRLVCLAAAVLLCLGMGQAPVLAEADFSQNAWDIVNDITFGWNLGNTLDAYNGTEMTVGDLSSENCWGNPDATPELIALVKSTGVNAIRVPVTWYNHMDPDTLQVDEAWMSRVEEVVNYVLDADMYCILNVHHDTGEKGWLNADPDGHEEDERIFIALWQQIAKRFEPYGGKLMFEGFNEILNNQKNWGSPSQECLDATNRLNQVFVDTVRASGGNNAQRVLVVNTYGAQSNALITKAMVVPQDTVEDRIIVEVHVYNPYNFTSPDFPNVKTWGRTELDSGLVLLHNTFVKQGYPLIIGEFGAVDKENMAQRYTWVQHLMDMCQKRGIKCFWWDDGGNYKLISRRSNTIVEPYIFEILHTEATGGDYLLDDETLEKMSKKAEENLCANLEMWSNWINTGAQAKAEVTYTAEGLSIAVAHGGANPWDAQGAYLGLTVEEGASYRISFDYKADCVQTITFNLLQDYGSYQTYYGSSIDMTTETQHFEDTFTMTAPTDKKTKIAFDFGGTGVSVPYTAEISNLTLVKLPQE